MNWTNTDPGIAMIKALKGIQAFTFNKLGKTTSIFVANLPNQCCSNALAVDALTSFADTPSPTEGDGSGVNHDNQKDGDLYEK